MKLDLCPWCTKTLVECVCHYVERRSRIRACTRARGVVGLGDD